MKLIKRIIYILPIFAMVFSISILTFYFHAAKIIGRLPYYSHPDPKELGIYELYDPILSITIEIWFYTFLLWLILIVVFIFITLPKPNFKPVLITLGIQTIPFIILFSPIFEWYVD